MRKSIKNKNQIKNKGSVKKSAPKRQKSKSKSKSCPPNMMPVKVKKELLCVGRCPHSGGPIIYNPKLDKFVCKWHGSQFSTSGKVLTPPANSNLKVKKL
jgi:Rieske Fe-S protein